MVKIKVKKEIPEIKHTVKEKPVAVVKSVKKSKNKLVVKTKSKKKRKKKNKPGAGRPTSYKKTYPQEVRNYTKRCEDEVEQFVKMVNIEKGYESFENRLKVNLPSIEGLSLELGVHKDTIYEWEKIHKEFSDALGELRSKQAKVLLNNGLSGTYNPTIAKLVLAQHGYKEQIETEVTHKGNINFSEEAEKRAKKYD